MRAYFRFLILCSPLAALLLGGCDTFSSRAKESPAFNQADPYTQQRLKRGEIAIGDSEELVQVALGNPDEKTSAIRENGRTSTWVYNVYYQEYAGSVHVGYRRIVVYDAARKRYVSFYEPVREEVFRQRADERLRVEFRSGLVSAVEETKP